MFTGLVEEVGVLASCRRSSGGRRLAVTCSPGFSADVKTGDSVSVNGCCLTAVEVASGDISFDAVEETVARSTIGEMQAGARLNLERSLRVGNRLGGHFVQGHVDGTGMVTSIADCGLERLITIKLSGDLLQNCIAKGSIAIDGISLTIAKLCDSGIDVAVIPHTWKNTNLSSLKSGSWINIETDMLGKWVRRILTGIGSEESKQGKHINREFLESHGFM